MSHLKVSHCMLQNQKQWDVPFLKAIFDQQTVTNIINTPLYPSLREDRLIWSKENIGDYSVRSAYRYCMQELLDTSVFKTPGNWDMIWKLKVPPKLKNFMWRLTRNVLPTRMRLWDKKVNCRGTCVLCNSAEEHNFHLFFGCPSSCNIQNMSVLSQPVSTITNLEDNCSNCIFQILHRLSNGDATLFACILWSIWKQRNNKVWNDVLDTQCFVIERAKCLLVDWEAVKIASARKNSAHNYNTQ